MKFIPIDWPIYNKPPFFPQWLSRGETKDLVRFDDGLFAELDLLMDEMSEQYDLDKAKAVLLDRIGKIVDEKREGNEDELYRLLIRLRILLNTTNGSVNDVIKVIKFIFSSEVVHIDANYPAGISILHDGESPSVDFNKYIAQVVGAGIAYDTREIFYFLENMPFKETDEKRVHKIGKEMFSNTVFRNGRVYRDGTTVLDTEIDYLYRNGAVYRDGSVCRDGYYRRPAIGHIRTPIYRNSGALDVLAMHVAESSVVDEMPIIDDLVSGKRNHYFRNGAYLRDGSIFRNSGILIPLE
jgi:hypothetical protein